MTRFVHLTDLHVSHARAADAGTLPDTPGSLRRAVGLINAMERQPDFVVASGDLTNMGDVQSYELLREILQPLEAPLVLALGNHDKRAGFHQVFGQPGEEGAFFHDQVLGDLHVITLDTMVPGRVAGTITEEQFDFLEAALAREAARPKLIVMHHPPRVEPAGLPWGTIDMAATERLAEVLEGQRVAGILSGHIHINRVSHWHGIPIFVSMGLNSTVDMLETRDLRIVEGTGFGIGEWRESGLSMAFVPLTPASQQLGLVDRARLEAFR
jgi:3',5'-cyclic AMP phosphodiesterase CpdA